MLALFKLNIQKIFEKYYNLKGSQKTVGNSIGNITVYYMSVIANILYASNSCAFTR